MNVLREKKWSRFQKCVLVDEYKAQVMLAAGKKKLHVQTILFNFSVVILR